MGRPQPEELPVGQRYLPEPAGGVRRQNSAELRHPQREEEAQLRRQHAHPRRGEYAAGHAVHAHYADVISAQAPAA